MNRVHLNREYILKQHNKTIKYTVAGDELINMNYADKWKHYYNYLNHAEAYHAGIRLPAFGSSPKYLSEFISYLYVGAKFNVPSDHPSNARPFLSSRTSCHGNM